MQQKVRRPHAIETHNQDGESATEGGDEVASLDTPRIDIHLHSYVRILRLRA